MKDREITEVDNNYIKGLYENNPDCCWSNDDLTVIRRVSRQSINALAELNYFKSNMLLVSMVTKGYLEVNINLQEYHLAEGDIIVVCRDSAIHAIGWSEDLNVHSFMISAVLLHIIFDNKVPPLYNQLLAQNVFHTTAEQQDLYLSQFNSLWKLVHVDSIEATKHGLAAILYFIQSLAVKQAKLSPEKQPRNMEIFNQFIGLLNANCNKYRNMDFYADKLCLNKQYLGTLISRISHRSASEWIEEATITRIKVMLLKSDMSINAIAREMSFQESSHLSRYFKRATGMIPADFRKTLK